MQNKSKAKVNARTHSKRKGDKANRSDWKRRALLNKSDKRNTFNHVLVKVLINVYTNKVKSCEMKNKLEGKGTTINGKRNWKVKIKLSINR